MHFTERFSELVEGFPEGWLTAEFDLYLQDPEQLEDAARTLSGFGRVSGPQRLTISVSHLAGPAMTVDQVRVGLSMLDQVRPVIRGDVRVREMVAGSVEDLRAWNRTDDQRRDMLHARPMKTAAGWSLA